jgi:SAM-dependent methyltransferase
MVGLARRVRGRVARWVRAGAGSPPGFPVVARPVPPATTEAELRREMGTIRVDDGSAEELAGYVDEAFGRFLHTWGLLRDERGRALELGANPYFLTWLLRRHTALDLELANYFGDDRSEVEQRVAFTTSDGVDHRWTLRSAHFNVERDPFPYPDASFDVVLFCETIEHLLLDPLHALTEINRILKPGGVLVVTTPNVARLGNVLWMVGGLNVHDRYSGHGPYGRHNREYTRHELVHLLRFAGFDEECSFTADSLPEDYDARPFATELAPLLRGRWDDLGQYLFVRAHRVRPPADGLPEFLYRSWPADRPLVDIFDAGQPWNRPAGPPVVDDRPA